MTAPRPLEDQLRDHYAAKANELRLPDVAFDDVLARGDVPVSVASSGSPRRGWIAGSVAAALVGGAVIGAGVVSLGRDDNAVGDRSVGLPPARPDAIVASADVDWCADAVMPDDISTMGLQNDVRIPGLMLPAATPEGFCAGDHQVTTLSDLPVAEYRVWTDCGRCESPTAAVARVDTGENLEVLYEHDAPGVETVDVGGHRGHYYPPNEDDPLGRLYVDLGANVPFTLAGWGLDASGFARVAAELVVDDGTANDVTGMELVYDNTLDSYWPGYFPFPATLRVGYYSESDISSLSYAVLDYQEQPPLEAYAWVRPNAAFATVDGLRTVSFPASAYADGTQATYVVVQLDENTQVMWSSAGTPPMTPHELAAIELTPASADDPRWLELAWESGCSECVG